MRDLLSYAVAALIGLLTLTLQPWSPQWWAGVIIASAIALITSFHIVWNNLPAPARAAIGPLLWKPTGYLRSWIGILLLCVLMGGGYFASRWPTGFLKSEPPPSENPPAPTGPIMSRLDHFILRCDVPPPPPSKTGLDSLWELQDYKQKLDILGDAIGVAFTMVTIRGGVRLEVEAVTEMAKQRMPLSKFGMTKVILEIRRIDKYELVSAFVNLPPQIGFYDLIPPNPAAPDSILLIQTIERFLGVQPGVCQII